MYFEEREKDYVYRPDDRGQDILCPKTSCLWNMRGVCSSIVNPTWIIMKSDFNIWNASERCFDEIYDFMCVNACIDVEYEE